MPVSTASGVQYGSGDFYTYILRDLYGPVIREALLNPNAMLGRLARSPKKFSGKLATEPLHTGRNRGISSIGEDGALPMPGNQSYERNKIPVRHMYGRIKFTGIAEDASGDSASSWASVIESEVKGLITDFNRDRNRIFHNDGSGAIGYVSAIGTFSTTQLVTIRANPLVELASAMGTGVDRFNPVRLWVEAGDTLAFVDDGGNGAVGSSTGFVPTTAITSVDKDAGTLTYTENVGAGGVAVGDLVVRYADKSESWSPEHSGWRRECMGIAGIFSDGAVSAYGSEASDVASGLATDSFQGIDPSTVDVHRAQILDVQSGGSNVALSPTHMHQMFLNIMKDGGVMPTAIYGSFGAYQAYLELGDDYRRYNDNIKKIDVGWETANYNGIPILFDRDCYSNRFYWAYEPGIEYWEMRPPAWMDRDGSVYSRMADRDAYQATYFCRENLACEVRREQGLLVGFGEAGETIS